MKQLSILLLALTLFIAPSVVFAQEGGDETTEPPGKISIMKFEPVKVQVTIPEATNVNTVAAPVCAEANKTVLVSVITSPAPAVNSYRYCYSFGGITLSRRNTKRALNGS